MRPRRVRADGGRRPATRERSRAADAAESKRGAPREDVRIGISSCLLGEKVRYDGGHKLDRVTTDLARFFTFVPVCPEVEVGMGVPREPIRLESRDGEVRLVAFQSGEDHTERMRRWAEARVRELERLDLSGYILKKDSPSCGMESVPLWRGAAPARVGRGAFAEVLMRRMPLLPVEEEGRLQDPKAREQFLARVFAYHEGKRGVSGRGRRRRSR